MSDSEKKQDNIETHLVFDKVYLKTIIILSIITFVFIYVSLCIDLRKPIPAIFLLSLADVLLVIRYLQPNIEKKENQPKLKEESAKFEYQMLIDRHSQRGSQIHTALSILIAGSFVMLIPIFSETSQSNMNIVKYLPFISIILMTATISLHATTRTLDKLTWTRINFIEKNILHIEGNNWINKTLKKRKIVVDEKNSEPIRIYQWFRHSIWPILLSFLFSIYVSIALYFLSIK